MEECQILCQIDSHRTKIKLFIPGLCTKIDDILAFQSCKHHIKNTWYHTNELCEVGEPKKYQEVLKMQSNKKIFFFFFLFFKISFIKYNK